MESGRLVLVATPIGNLADMSPRAAEAVGAAGFWLLEDTRVNGKVEAQRRLRKSMRVINDHTSESPIARYLEEIRAGSNAALLTDGGTPVVSDPGAILCDLCLDATIEVDSIPGPSAVTK